MSDSVTLLPPNATELEKALARCAARVSSLGVTAKMLALWNPATCPAATLPWLAQALHVDEWSETWTEAQKRAVIAASVATHKRKGTIGALKRALAALGYEVVVDEDTGIPFTFRLAFDLNQTGVLGTDTFAAARRVAMANKNARSKLLAVRSSMTATAGVYGAVAHHRAQTVTVDAGEYDFTLTAVVTGGGSFLTGATVTLTCVATSGAWTLSLQWHLGGVAIEGATSSTYSFTLSDATDGDYTCVASNGIMEPVTSNTASVIIAGIVSQFSSLVGGSDICQASNGNFYVVSTSGVYEVLQDGTYSLISTTATGNGICQKSDGYLYVSGNVTWKLDTSGNTVQYSLRGGNRICEGYNGLLYVTGFDTNSDTSAIWSINSDGTYQRFASVGYYPYTPFEGICYDGTNFYAKNGNNSLVAVISNSGSIVTSNLVQVDGETIINSSDGFLYVLSSQSQNALQRVTKAGVVTSFSTVVGQGIYEASDHNFYVVNYATGIFKVTH